jgi:hypothetical protein
LAHLKFQPIAKCFLSLGCWPSFSLTTKYIQALFPNATTST